MLVLTDVVAEIVGVVLPLKEVEMLPVDDTDWLADTAEVPDTDAVGVAADVPLPPAVDDGTFDKVAEFETDGNTDQLRVALALMEGDELIVRLALGGNDTDNDVLELAVADGARLEDQDAEALRIALFV